MAEGAGEEGLTVGFKLHASNRWSIQNNQGKKLSALGAIKPEVISACLALYGLVGLSLGRKLNRARHFRSLKVKGQVWRHLVARFKRQFA